MEKVWPHLCMYLEDQEEPGQVLLGTEGPVQVTWRLHQESAEGLLDVGKPVTRCPHCFTTLPTALPTDEQTRNRLRFQDLREQDADDEDHFRETREEVARFVAEFEYVGNGVYRRRGAKPPEPEQKLLFRVEKTRGGS